MTVVKQLIGPAFSCDLWQNCLGNELGSPDDEFFDSLGCVPIYLPLIRKSLDDCRNDLSFQLCQTINRDLNIYLTDPRLKCRKQTVKPRILNAFNAGNSSVQVTAACETVGVIHRDQAQVSDL